MLFYLSWVATVFFLNKGLDALISDLVSPWNYRIPGPSFNLTLGIKRANNVTVIAVTHHFLFSIHRCEGCRYGGRCGGGNIPWRPHCHINHLARLQEEREKEVRGGGNSKWDQVCFYAVCIISLHPCIYWIICSLMVQTVLSLKISPMTANMFQIFAWLGAQFEKTCPQQTSGCVLSACVPPVHVCLKMKKLQGQVFIDYL